MTGVEQDRYEFRDGFPEADAVGRAWADVDFQRAVTAYRFWYPTVSLEGILNGNREVGLTDGKAIGIVAAGPRQVGFTLNSDTPYGSAALDLRDGPMVVELPAGAYIGLLDDHHQRWITDMGIPGPDGGKGGTYVVTPPGYDRDVELDAHVVHSGSFTVLLALRSLPLQGDQDAALAALRAVRVYRLGAHEQTLDFVDTTELDMDNTCLRWEDGLEFWRVLHRVLSDEPLVAEFTPMYGLLADLGIERGGDFAPDRDTAALLERAARAGRDQMLVSAFAGRRADRIAWADRGWEWVGLVEDNGDFRTESGFDLDARERWFIQAIIASPAMFRRQVGGGSLYWLGVRDGAGDFLDGGNHYTLDIPQPVPAKLFWSITVYDAATRSQVRAEQNSAALRSLFELRDLPTDEPLRLHFGPTCPPGAEQRWLQTVPGHGWFVYLRIYGPEQAAFDGSWKPGDFERA
ncbi:DUF1214 domain-containing protein [Nocardia sp. NPDC057668]|uniref:DUF1214 domain-containing protein n=1 Tax=Nocardia sp. NPDC057668 TaxID=3346202 RepID=UPI00367334CC